MSMDKAIEHGKEHRKPWRGSAKSKNIDRTCCNHGSCDYCKFNRLHTFTKNILTVTFDKLGLLQGIVLDGSADNMGIISKAEAVEIVLRELRSSKYTLPEFENEGCLIWGSLFCV